MARRDKLTTPAKGNKSKVVEQQVVQVTDGKHKGRVGQVSASKRGGWNEVILSDNEEKINIRATMFRPVRMSAAGEAKGLEREAPIQEELQHEDTTEKKERNRGGRKEETGGSAVKAGSPPMQHTATPPVDEARPSRLEELMRRALNGSSSALSSRSIPPQLNRAGQFGSARLHSGLEAPSTAAGRAKQSILHAAPNLVREGGSALPLRRRPRADIGATLVSHASDPAAARDAAIVKMRNFIDPKRFYKAPDIMSATFQVGTVHAGSFEGQSSVLSRRERRSNMADELLADQTFRAYSKRKMSEIQETGKLGRKRHLAIKKAKRQPKWMKASQRTCLS